MKTGQTYRILLADDHSVFRRGLKTLIESQEGLAVCAEASNGREAVALAKETRPHMAILDITMPDMDGLAATRDIRQSSPATEVLILSMHESERMVLEALRAGACGYVVKSDAEHELLAAIDDVRHHKPHLTGQLAGSMLRAIVNTEKDGETGKLAEWPLIDAPLTARQIEIVKLLAGGKSNKEIAASLNVSARTVESHRYQIMHKMNFASLSDLVRFAVRSNLVEP